MTARDPVLVDLARHEASQALTASASELAERRAVRDVMIPEELADLIAYHDKGSEVASCLARCFANLDSACRGQEIGRDAITTSLHNLKQELISLYVEDNREDIEEELQG